MTTPTTARERELRAALAGVDLTENDHRLLSWLATWDQLTTDRLVTLIVRARATPTPTESAATRHPARLSCVCCRATGPETRDSARRAGWEPLGKRSHPDQDRPLACPTCATAGVTDALAGLLASHGRTER